MGLTRPSTHRKRGNTTGSGITQQCNKRTTSSNAFLNPTLTSNTPSRQSTYPYAHMCMPSLIHRKPYKVVTAWRYEGSAASVPWRALGDMLFEMGACSCSVSVEEDYGEQEATDGGKERSVREAAFAVEGGQEDRKPMLTFIVEEGKGWGHIGAALEVACELAGGLDSCFGEIDDR